ncbi:hypothetical protein IK112_02555 [Candidatus Saccharibacteria bacterium]|nr:hypothetical protein [Candidatus Saccharibacteria bacterium]
MQIITILSIAVAILTFLSGVAVLSGARKGERLPAVLVFAITLFSSLWAFFCVGFLNLPENSSPDTINIFVYGIYISALPMTWGLMAYTCHKYTFGKIAMALYGLFCAGLIAVLIYDKSLLYSDITLSQATGNVVHIRQDLYYILYCVYFVTTCTLYMIGLWLNARRARTPQIRKGNLVVLCGFSLTGGISLIFNAFLPYFGTYSMIWVGPVALSIAWIMHYYAILRYRLLDLASSWLRLLSNVIILSLAAIVYLATFFIIFSAIFKTSSPSTAVIILNIIMIVVALILMPALNELSGFVRSLASTYDVDMVYIVKKLSALSRQDINYYELSDFLADHLHFQYVGIIIGEKLYSSGSLKLPSADIKKIASLKNHSRSIWLSLDEELRTDLRKQEIEAVGELRDGKGEVIGQVIIGKPLGKINFATRDLAPVEVALTLTAATISTADKNPHIQ